ncbi:hypothetical protein HK096_004824, partial [Nowakowskiella sp. JEL0078]
METCTVNGIHYLLGSYFPIASWFGPTFVLVSYFPKVTIFPDEKGNIRLEIPGEYFTEPANGRLPEKREETSFLKERRSSLKVAAVAAATFSRFKRRTSESSVFSKSSIESRSLLQSSSLLEQSEESDSIEPTFQTFKKTSSLSRSMGLASPFLRKPSEEKAPSNTSSVPDLSTHTSPIESLKHLSFQSQLSQKSASSFISEVEDLVSTTQRTEDDDGDDVLDFMDFLNGKKKIREQVSLIDILKSGPATTKVANTVSLVTPGMTVRSLSYVVMEDDGDLMKNGNAIRYLNSMGRKLSITGHFGSEINLPDLKWLSGQLKVEKYASDSKSGLSQLQCVWATIRDYRFQLFEGVFLSSIYVGLYTDNLYLVDVSVEMALSFPSPLSSHDNRFVIVHETGSTFLHATSRQQMFSWVAMINTASAYISNSHALKKKRI